MSWWAVLALGIGSYAIKAVGPFVLGDRASAPWLTRIAALLTPALIAALVATQTFGDGRALTIDARAAGLAVAVVAVWRQAPFLVVVLSAAVTAAALRAFT